MQNHIDVIMCVCVSVYVCVWIFVDKRQVVDNSELKEDGKYEMREKISKSEHFYIDLFCMLVFHKLE